MFWQMQEIQKVLATEINPTLERLRGEKKHYMKWSANNSEASRVTITHSTATWSLFAD